jgi:hypothetical protein
MAMKKRQMQGSKPAKRLGETTERAMEDADRHESARAGAIPPAEAGEHGRSHAAHLAEEHTRGKSEGNLQHGKEQGELRQPLPIEQHLQQRISGRHK